MVDLSPWQYQDILAHSEPQLCPHAESWVHADIAESLDMPVGTLLHDGQGFYCPACDFRPEKGRRPR